MTKPSEPDRYSATQVSVFRDCRRKWFVGWVVGVRGPQNAYAALGERIHKVLRAYLEDGTLPGGDQIEITVIKPNGQEISYTGDDLLQIILPYLGELPAPGVAKVEGFFELDLGGLGTMVGYIDYQFDEDVPVVGDHKTTSDLGWALKPAELVEDPQGVIYAVKALEESDAQEVELRWGYVRRDPKKPGKKIVKARMSLTDTTKSWQNILQDVRAMKALRESGCEPGQVPYDATACDKYGGCPHRGNTCRLSPMDRMKGLSAMLNLKERMKAAKTAPAAVAPTQPAPAQGAGQAVNPPEGQSALARLKARQAQPAPASQPVQTTAAQVDKAMGEVAAAQIVAAANPTAKPAKARAPKAAPAPDGFTLYVNAAPSTPYTLFAEIAKVVGDTIETEKGTPYRLIPDLYGGAPALFAKAVTDYLQLNPPGDIVMDLASEPARDALDAVAALASKVVRGF